MTNFELQIEDDYRRTGWKPNRFQTRDYSARNSSISSNTLNAYFDILVSGLLLVIVSLACFLHYPPTIPWAVFFSLSIVYHAVLTTVCFVQLVSTPHARRKTAIGRLYSWGRGWVPSHVFGVVLLALPILAAFANFQCARLNHGGGESREFYLEICFFGIVHFTNLTALNNWVKSTVASVMSVVIVILVSPLVCSNCLEDPTVQAVRANIR